MSHTVSFSTRLALAWRVLTDAVFASRIGELEHTPPTAPQSAPVTLKETLPEAALQLLGLFPKRRSPSGFFARRCQCL